MKHLILAVPATLILATAGIAQTTTTADTATGEFGTNWPLSVGTTFLTDDTSATLRPTEELTQGWQSLSPEDQAMIRADCDIFRAAHGDAAATGDASTSSTTGTESGTASTDTTTGSGTDTATRTGTAETGAASTDTTATVDAATTAPTGYDMAEMKAICEAVGKL